MPYSSIQQTIHDIFHIFFEQQRQTYIYIITIQNLINDNQTATTNQHPTVHRLQQKKTA